jgi:hypothetical protein
MSMIHAEAGRGVTLAATPYQGNRSRISWGAVIAGAVVAVATSLLLSLLGAAIGAGSINVLNASSSELTSYGTGAAIWQAINFVLSMAFGGYVASRLSGTHSHLDGELHGVTVWGLAVLLSSVLLAQALSSVVGLVGRETGSVVNRAVGNAATLTGVLGPEADQRTLLDRLESLLGNSNDLTTMNHDQIGREIAGLVGTSLSDGSLSEPNRNRLVSLVAAQYGITRDDAAQRVTRMENDVKTRVAQVEQRAREAADTAAHSASLAARALFTALVLGLLGALVGAWLGTRHKRILHPVVEHELAPALATHSVYETARPIGVSIYDDADRLVSQYLRGVSFPVNKQDLIRMARSSNAGAGLLHSIEGMSERSYASANDVLRELNLTH